MCDIEEGRNSNLGAEGSNATERRVESNTHTYYTGRSVAEKRVESNTYTYNTRSNSVTEKRV